MKPFQNGDCRISSTNAVVAIRFIESNKKLVFKFTN